MRRASRAEPAGTGPKDASEAATRPTWPGRSHTSTTRPGDQGLSGNEPADVDEGTAHYRTVVELSPNGILSIDHEGRILEFNPAAEKMFGYKRADVIGQPMAELIVPPHLRSAHYRGLKRYLDTGEARILGRRLELDAMRADGTVIPVEIAIVRIPLPGLPVFTSYVRDLTAQRRSSARQKILADAGAILNETLDYEQTLRNLSRAVIPALADWYSADIRDPESGEVRRIHVDHRDPDKVAIARLLARRYPNTREDRGVLAVLRTGRTEWLREIPADLLERSAQSPEHLEMLKELGLRSYILVPLSAHHQVYGTLSLVTAESGRLYDEEDVALAEELGRRAGQAIENARLFREIDHQRRQLQEQQTELEAQATELEEASMALSEANARLEQNLDELRERTREAVKARTAADEANRAKSEFLAAMSHELRTPLNAILGYVDLLSMEIHGPVTNDQAGALGRVKQSGQHLLVLINDILNFAKLEAGRIRYRIRTVPVSDVLKTAAEILAPQVSAKRIAYRERNDCPGAAVCADREKLVQILVNLLGNAVRHTPTGGTITISCDRHGTDIKISVQDTGTGIPRDKLEAIFEPFVQVESAYEGERQGTGLGLSISRDLARAMQGDVIVESRLGKGSTFTVRLPAAEPRRRQASGPGDEAVAKVMKRRRP